MTRTKVNPATKTDAEADNEKRLPGPGSRSSGLQDELRQERVSGVPEVPEDVKADDVDAGSSRRTHWFPLDRKVYSKLEQGSNWLLKLYCHLLYLRKQRQFWKPSYNDGFYYRNRYFESLNPDTVVFDLKTLVKRTGKLAWRLKEDIRLLFNYGYLSFVMFESMSPDSADCMGGSVLEYVGEWDGSDDDWPVSAVQLPIFKKGGFFKVPEEIIDAPEDELVFLLAVFSRARYSSKPVWYKGKPYTLRRGQFVMSISELARELELDRLKCNRLAHKLHDTGYLKRIPEQGDYLWTVNLVKR